MTYLASRLLGTPLLIHRPKLDVILSVVGQRIGMADVPPMPAMDMTAFQRPVAAAAPEGIAVIPIHGSLVKRALGMEAASGLTSYSEIATMLEAAIADPQVAGILLDIDSPGGEASGSFELARRVREVAAVKPVWAVANDAAYSAAYAIAASAQRLFVTETGGVGSIGVIALHVDQSVKDANAGYRFTAITAGAHKNDYSPHEPLSDAARTELQGEVDRLYAIFTEHVAAMRGLDAGAVRATEAGLYFGSNAVGQGLADGVQTLETTLSEFHQFINALNRPSSQVRGVPRAEAAHPRKDLNMNEEEKVIDTIGVDEAAAQLATQLAERVAEARREVTQTAQAIAEVCMLAGCPERAAEFIAAGKTEAGVRRVLIDARAAQTEATDIRSTITVDAGTAIPSHAETSPIVAAVKKLTGTA
ncbi:MAG: S49 family peptidase [Rhodocyclaceae bacterium]|nr:S49 family peptidase [Rhodocyclaceae bacterium]MDZ4215588.1 S49 family peptidase [Rhodocyclaceae bacterium]